MSNLNLPKTHTVARGKLRLGQLLTWSHLTEVRFFYRNEMDQETQEDFESLSAFESWLAQQLGLPRDGLVIRPVKVAV
jgi:predicted thioredoxin/glutaredoxin